MYYKNENNEVYWESSEQPAQAFTPEEWIIEQKRLIVGLTKQIDSLQVQINNAQPIEVLESYPRDVKKLIERNNSMLSSVGDLEMKKQKKTDLKNHIEGL